MRTPPYAMLVSNRDFGLTNSRLPLMAALAERGYTVVAATAPERGTVGLLHDQGVVVETVPFSRGQFSLSDARALRTLRRLYVRYRPALIHHFNAKPIVYGGLAAQRLPDTRVVHTVTGMGYGYGQPGVNRMGSALAYRLIVPHADAVIFQNPDDRDLFIRNGWVYPEISHLIVSSGVDIQRFYPSITEAREPPRVLMVSRLLRQKGVMEFIAAARACRAAGLNAEFVLSGEWQEGHPDALDPRLVTDAADEGVIAFVGYIDDMPTALRSASVFVLPSYYLEGVPRVLLEAAACGVPVITADTPGCREALIPGKTGLTVPPRDSNALASAVTELVRDDPRRRRMAAAGRERMVKEFSLEAITHRQVAVYEDLALTRPH